MMPSDKAKQRWNAAHYTQVKVSVNPEIATAFKAACAARDVSQAHALSGFMAEYSQASPDKSELKDVLDSRKRRRAAIKTIVAQMEKVLAAEERYRDNVPGNLQGAKWHEASESSINLMQEIIDLMADIYG